MLPSCCCASVSNQKSPSHVVPPPRPSASSSSSSGADDARLTMRQIYYLSYLGMSVVSNLISLGINSKWRSSQ